MLISVEGNAVQGRITEAETSARSESKRMTNHNTPQLSRMDPANHCAAFPGLSRLNTRAVHATGCNQPSLRLHVLSWLVSWLVTTSSLTS
jgi:hypothetical protein